MTDLLMLLWQEQTGQDLTEYALLLALPRARGNYEYRNASEHDQQHICERCVEYHHCDRSLGVRTGLVSGIAQKSKQIHPHPAGTLSSG